MVQAEQAAVVPRPVYPAPAHRVRPLGQGLQALPGLPAAPPGRPRKLPVLLAPGHLAEPAQAAWAEARWAVAARKAKAAEALRPARQVRLGEVQDRSAPAQPAGLVQVAAPVCRVARWARTAGRAVVIREASAVEALPAVVAASRS